MSAVPARNDPPRAPAPTLPGAETRSRITYGDLWQLADFLRGHAELWAAINDGELVKAVALGDAVAADIYRRAVRDHRERAAMLEALQKLIARIETSKTIRDELARLAAEERSRPGGVAMGGESMDGSWDGDAQA